MHQRHIHHQGGRSGRPTDKDIPNGPFGGRGPSGLGRRRRGDVRAALMVTLLDGPAHGYELIQALEAKTGGRWRPSPGAVYPALQLLADTGMVTATDIEGRKVYELTEAGTAEATSLKEAFVAGRRDMNGGEADGPRGQFRAAVHELMGAARQIGMNGTPELVEKATQIVTQARKELYRLLADA